MDEEVEFPHSVEVLFRPGMMPADRWIYEDALSQALEEKELGEVNGGGTALDGSFCDIAIDLADLKTGMQLVREVLKKCNAPETTVIVTSSSDGSQPVEHPVYE